MRFFLAILTLLFLVPTFGGQENSQKPLYRPTGKETTLIGSIFYDNEEVPEPKKIDMGADPVCAEMNRPYGRTNDLRVTDGALINAVVYVKSGGLINAYRFEVPETDVALVQKNCQFAPRVVGLRAGQKITITNHDPTVHNVHPTPRINQEWNQSYAPDSPPIWKTFSRPEQFIPVKCNQHPWERAILGVFAHPFFAVSDQFGNYEIRGLPEGAYTLVVWHEKLGEKEIEVNVVAGESRRLDFTFDELGTIRSSWQD